MNGLFERMDKRFLFFAALASAVLTSAVFLLSYFKNLDEMKNLPSLAIKEKIPIEAGQGLFFPVRVKGQDLQIPQEVLDSLSAPAATPVMDQKDNKTVQPTSTPTLSPIPKEVLDNLSVPNK